MEKPEKKKAKKVVEHNLRAMQEQLYQKWPVMARHLKKMEESNPSLWEDLLNECDVLIHEERKNAVEHNRLHGEEIREVERTIDHWETTEKYIRFAVYRFLLYLQSEHVIDRPLDAAEHDAKIHAAELSSEEAPPPESAD